MMDEFQLEIGEEEMISSISCEIDSLGIRFPKLDLHVNSDGMSNISTGSKIKYNQNSISASDIEIGEVIGTGASSFVCKGIYKPSNYPIGVKTVNVFDKDKRHQMLNDFKVLLTQYTHPNLITCYGAFYDEGTIKIVLELMDFGSISNLITILKEMQQGSSNISPAGLEFLHRQRHHVHRDIKPENILINKRGEVKLTDFGISKQLEKTQELCKTFVGTTLYMSPERLIGNSYGLRSDIWSVGLVIIELVTGQYPYNSKNQGIIQFVSNILSSPEPSLPNDGVFSPLLVDFVKKCVSKEQKDRLDVSDLLNHEWLAQYNLKEGQTTIMLQEYLFALELGYYQFKQKQAQSQQQQQQQSQQMAPQ